MCTYTYTFNNKTWYVTILHSPASCVQWAEALSSCNNPCLYRTARSCSYLQYCTECQGFHFHLIGNKFCQNATATRNSNSF